MSQTKKAPTKKTPAKKTVTKKAPRTFTTTKRTSTVKKITKTAEVTESKQEEKAGSLHQLPKENLTASTELFTGSTPKGIQSDWRQEDDGAFEVAWRQEEVPTEPMKAATVTKTEVEPRSKLRNVFLVLILLVIVGVGAGVLAYYAAWLLV